MGLFHYLPTRPDICLDVYAQSVKIGSKVRIKALTHQGLFVECSRTLRDHYPIGTIFKLDARLVTPTNKKPYLVALQQQHLERAIEFFNYNISLQQGHTLSYS